jgi:hypothetical protein
VIELNLFEPVPIAELLNRLPSENSGAVSAQSELF